MSILDPAYPPARQKVYLEVSQPCALVNIARATDESGPLAPVLIRGEIGGKDLFAQVREKAGSQPDVLVGPDSAPTLSFTSGSEGRPKGVLGRHFSLAKYFGWMAKRFELSSESPVHLIIGDIFTPLYLGAQLLVPSREDIQHEKLAEWMREHKPTVTHLTPAMGQILVGGATAEFPSLNRAFFVGDVLTTRDCRSLRKLAVNAHIVNMYGTTESQRFPEMGMENVQLLVVNREDSTKLCGIGEVGEIYVRGAGLAEDYKGDQALNDKKFLMNWFVDNKIWEEKDKMNKGEEPWKKYYKGPRDRVYRTGDLGRYLESGNVECTGRRTTRDCKTLVRRDKCEEPILVSYIVPEINVWPQWLKSRGLEEVEDEGIDMGTTIVYNKRFRWMQAEVRDHLKGRLPNYAVPTVYIVLNKLPLNPNGKIDKQNLPFADIAEQTDEASEDDLKRWDSSRCEMG
ncbi:large subunit of alpha-aminoadipate reductase [Arachnomyces sp. PD_36]|nr:large subunit of alpha-aminoadipate reductase [Arachnomyces sp. PD_36]